MTRRAILLTALFSSLALAADPALLNLLPSEATMVAGIDVDQGKNSPFGQYLLTHWRGDDKGFSEFIDLTGFDPRRDLREVVFASLSTSSRTGMFAARGSFDIPKVLSAARSKGAQTLVYQGANIVSGKDDTGNGWIAFLDGATVIGGEETAVRAALDRREAAAKLSVDLAAKLTDLSRKYDAWMYTLSPGASFGQIADPKADVRKGVRAASGGVKFGANIVIAGEAVARSDKDAVALQDVIRFLAGMVQFKSEEHSAAQVATLLESLQVSTNANLVSVSLNIPQAQLEKMLEDSKRPKARRRAAAI